MRRVRVVNTTRGSELASAALLADRWWQRARGMLGRPAPLPGQGMLLSPCRAVHMAGMRYPLDVAFLDADGAVVAICAGLPPGARSGWVRHARQALELPAGTLEASGTRTGDRIAILPL